MSSAPLLWWCPSSSPLGEAFGIDPVHLGIIFLANLELGFLTPPVGMNLFLSAYRFNKSLFEVYRSIIPILLVLLCGRPLDYLLPSLDHHPSQLAGAVRETW